MAVHCYDDSTINTVVAITISIKSAYGTDRERETYGGTNRDKDEWGKTSNVGYKDGRVTNGI